MKEFNNLLMALDVCEILYDGLVIFFGLSECGRNLSA
jgi:hypothetical protein